MTLIKAQLNLSRASAEKVKNKALLIVQKMTGNADFPNPEPLLADIEAKAQQLIAKQAEQDATFQTYHQKTLELKKIKTDLHTMLEKEANYVEVTANNDDTKIVGA